LGSFFFGYVLTQVPGGRLSEKYGGKTIFGWGIFLTSLFTVLSPPAAYMGEGAFIFIRILEGLSEVRFCTYKIFIYPKLTVTKFIVHFFRE